MRLSAARVGGAPATQQLVMLHGIYGRGRNWQAIAKAVVARRPDYACWLVDLPHHGASGPGRHGDTVRGLAADLEDWVRAEGVQGNVLLGHSFGGKVALAAAERHRSDALQIWVIDSTPETRAPGGSAWDMLRIVRGLPATFGSRDEAAEGLVAAGYARGVAAWMTTNLVRVEDRFVWRLDFAAMDRLLHDFFTTDLWPVVEQRAPAHEFHFLKASTSSAMSDAAASRIEALADPQVRLHRRDGSHWIHTESPKTVVDLLLAFLP